MTRVIGLAACLSVATWSSAAAAEPPISSFPPPPSPELLPPLTGRAEPVGLHPPVVLRDDEAKAVLESEKPVSPGKTCGRCHDAEWISQHSSHALFGMDDCRSRGHEPEMNCFLCHVAGAAQRERIAELEAGRFGWAATATLSGSGLFRRDGAAWRPVRDAFTDDGAVKRDRWQIRPPTPQDCGTCHGVVHDSTEPLTLATRSARDRMTETQGVVFSGQRISQSALNIAHKQQLSRPWDVHAERLVACHNCHFAPNNPAYAFSAHSPAHLAFDARRLDLGEYLLRPDHRFTAGPRTRAGGMRRCENCHDAPRVHGWLPRLERHLSRLSCESCHVPRLYAPARAQTDWSMLVRPGEPRITYRGSAGAVTDSAAWIEGYRPVLLPRRSADGTSKLAPFNLMVTWFWATGEGSTRRPVPREILSRAFFRATSHRPELVRALDRDGDGRLEPGELVLDTAERVATARRLLMAEGVVAPELVGEIEAYGIHHGVAPGRFATRECRTCHAPASQIDASFELAGPVPFGVEPTLVGDAPVRLDGTLVRRSGGQIAWLPDVRRRDLYLLGHSRVRGIDGVGLGAVLLALLGASIHAVLRWRMARRRRGRHGLEREVPA